MDWISKFASGPEKLPGLSSNDPLGAQLLKSNALFYFIFIYLFFCFGRVSLEKEHKSALENLQKELEDSRKSETNLRRELSKKSSELTSLQKQLEESRTNLEYSYRKVESLSEQYEKTIDQQAKVTVKTEFSLFRID